MTAIKVPTIAKQGFTLAASQGATPTVRFSGNGDMDAIAELTRFLTNLHDELLKTGALRVAVDLNELYFMNSSCLKSFVTWIHRVDTAGRPYKITFLSNPRLHWQKRSLATLQRLAPTVVSIEESA